MEWHPDELNFNQEPEQLAPIALEDFKAICTELFNLREEAEAIDAQLSAKNGQIEALKQKILAYFEQYKMDSFKVPGLGLVGTQTKFQVTMPKEPDAKAKFMDYIKSNAEDLLTVNHQTLNAYYNSQVEQGITELPGLEPPKARTIITMRRSK